LITAARALEILRRGHALADVQLDEPLDLRELADGDSIREPITIVRCRLDELRAISCRFLRPVAITDCELGGLTLTFSYFPAGFALEGSTCAGEADFQCGGHNDGGAFRIDGTTFEAFVNFFDCWFTGSVTITDSAFLTGTNLLGNRRQPSAVQFDEAPHIERTTGDLYLEGG
jgi:hypothetical protein